ncbi:MAG: hypothetical protein EBY28_16840 [Betaproteobacteria bacterium]|nr:hypothetical protein [Betaproteobacteria bacterium]
MDLSARYPTLSALFTADPERAHTLLAPIELALAGESEARIAQAIQWAKALGLKEEDVLQEVPEIPVTLLQSRGNLNLLTLVPFHLGNTRLAEAAGLKYEELGYRYTDDILIPTTQRYAALPTTWAWVLAHDGAPNLGRKATDCLAECTGELYAGVDKVGLAIWLIHRPRWHVMDLPGSVHASFSHSCACLYPFGDEPRLIARMAAGVANPYYGTVVFRL